MIFQFSYAELEQATNKFSSNNVVGHGGSSCVYRGQLKDGKTAAIKRLNAPKGDDNDALFTTEVYKTSFSCFLGKKIHDLMMIQFMKYYVFLG